MTTSKKKKENKLDHPCFLQPKDWDIKVWRYMDIAKFLDLISRRRLFLSRLDSLGDAHEGSITKVGYDARQEALQKRQNTKIIPMMANVNKRMNKAMFVNCWYLDNHESEAMWKLYCPNNKGIAIQTTYRKLVGSINFDDFLYIGQIKYIDYETEWFPEDNLFYPVMHKRKAFEYEKEIRLVKSDSKYWGENIEEPPRGIHVPWDLTVLDNIYVNPYSDAWYYELIKDVAEKYQCNINIKWSDLKGAAYY